MRCYEEHSLLAGVCSHFEKGELEKSIQLYHKAGTCQKRWFFRAGEEGRPPNA